MAKSYAHKFPIEVYWTGLSGEVRSQYFTDSEYAQKKIDQAIAHNKRMGYLNPDPGYKIRDRIPIERKGSGRKAKE